MKLYEVLVDNIFYYPDNECVSILVVANDDEQAIEKACQNESLKFYDKEKCEFTATEIDKLDGYKIKLEPMNKKEVEAEDDISVEDLW